MTIQPEGERVKMAVRWISDHLQDDPSSPVMPWVHRAIARFDLTPKEGEELIAFYRLSTSPGRSD